VYWEMQRSLMPNFACLRKTGGKRWGEEN
jgi:hypothetical protein